VSADDGHLYQQAHVLPALGFLVFFGDPLAALGQGKNGETPRAQEPPRQNATLGRERRLCAFPALWALLFVRWPVAIQGALSGGGWLECPVPDALNKNTTCMDNRSKRASFSVLNLVLGR